MNISTCIHIYKFQGSFNAILRCFFFTHLKIEASRSLTFKLLEA